MFDDIIIENVINILLGNYKIITFDSGLYFTEVSDEKVSFSYVLKYY